jgi:hypothetical protein
MLLKKFIFIVFLVFSLTFTLVLGCENEEPAERAGEAVEDTGEAAEEGLEDTGEAVEEGGEEVEEGAREAQQD